MSQTEEVALDATAAREPAAPSAGRPAPQGAHDMTQGSVRAHIVRMTLFVLAGITVQTLYGLVDIYWVSRLGKEAVAAVALSSNLMFLSLAVTQMLAVGCVALVSRAMGKKEHGEVQRLFNQAMSLATIAGVVFLTASLALRNTYAKRLASDALTAELASTFLLALLPALALQFPMVALGSALRGIGDMKPGLVAQTASVLLNMALAPFLVFGWIGGHPLGVSGASIATLVSTVLAVGGLMLYLGRGKAFLRLRLADWRPDFATWRAMIGVGLPSGAEFLLLSITMSVVYAVTKPFGAQAQAGVGIGSRLMQAGFMPAVAISFSVAAVVGQNFGARDFDRVREARRESAKLVVAFMVFFTVLCHLAPERLVAIFASDPEVVAAGVDYLVAISWSYVASGVVFVSAGVFQGLGNTWPSLGASALRAVGFVAPVVWMSRFPGFTLRSIWIVSVAATFFQFGVQQLLLGRELRVRAKISAPRATETLSS